MRRCRWRKRSQSVQRLPHMLHRMMAAVSPSSWLSHMGCRSRKKTSIDYVFDRQLFSELFSFGVALRLLCFSPSASAVHLCPSSDLTTACQHGPGPAHTVRLKPATTIEIIEQNILIIITLFFVKTHDWLVPVINLGRQLTFNQSVYL